MIPKLRFKDFDGAWVERRLGDFIEERVEFPQEDFPLFSLTIENGIVPKSERYERSFLVKSEEDNYKVMRENDFAMNPMNLRFGALAKHKGQTPVLVSKYYNIFTCKNEEMAEFLEPFLTSERMLLFYNKMATGSLNEKKRIHFSDFIHFKLLFPTHPEQKKIANFLTQADKKISQLSRQKQLLEQFKKGLMQRIFSREIRFLDADGRAFGEWERRKLGEVATFSKGAGIAKTDVVEGGKLECIRYGELYTHYSEVISEVKSRTNADATNLVLSIENDVIIPSSGETKLDIAKASCVLKSGIALGGDLNIIRSSLNGVFFAYYLNSVKKQEIAKLAQGISVVHLYASQLAMLEIELPPLAEQEKIATHLSQLDEQIGRVGEQLAAFRVWKRGLLRGMFV